MNSNLLVFKENIRLFLLRFLIILFYFTSTSNSIFLRRVELIYEVLSDCLLRHSTVFHLASSLMGVGIFLAVTDLSIRYFLWSSFCTKTLSSSIFRWILMVYEKTFLGRYDWPIVSPNYIILETFHQLVSTLRIPVLYVGQKCLG